MRNIVIGICSFVFIVLITIISATLYGRHSREVEIDNATNYALNAAIESLQEDRNVKPQSEAEFIAFFIETLTSQIKSSTDIKVDVLDVDYEKGLLSVIVTGTYKHPNGNIGTITCQKMAVLEKYYNDNASEECIVTYFVDGIAFREYTLQVNDYYVVPDSSITAWKDSETGSVYTSAQLSAMKVTKSTNFIAQ